MASNNSNRPGGRRPNSPRYSERYGPGHVNPYMGAQPGQSEFIREMEERHEAARRQSEENARRQREQEAELALRTQTVSEAEADARQEPSAAAVQARRREREDTSQPRAMRDPKMKERLRQIQERAVREAKSFARGDEVDFGDIDFVQQPADVRLRLSEDNQPLIALETEDSEGNKSVRWVPVVLSEKEMETFFPAYEPTKESKGIEVEKENRNPAENTAEEQDNVESSVDELVLIPIAGNDEDEQHGTLTAGTAELPDGEPTGQEGTEPEKTEKKPASIRGEGLSALLGSLPSIEIEPEIEPEPQAADAAGIPAAVIAAAEVLDAVAHSAPEPQEESDTAAEIPPMPVVEYDIADSDIADSDEDAQSEPESDPDVPAESETSEDSTEAEQSEQEESDDEEESVNDSPEDEQECVPDETEEDTPGEAAAVSDEDSDSDEESEQDSDAGEPAEEIDSEPEDDSADDADDRTGQDEQEKDTAAMPDEDAQPEEKDETPRSSPEPVSRPRHKRRRSRPTDVQMPEELAAAAAAKEEAPEPEPEITALRRTAVAAAPYYDDVDDGDPNDRMFRRVRRAVAPAFTMHEGATLPRYIDDDDFVERWLGDEEDEDLASQKKNRRRKAAAFIGAATMILALIGFIAVAKWGIGLLGSLGGSESQKDIYGEYISPVVMSEVPVFEAWDAIPQDKLLQSAVFTVLMDNDVTYERDDTGKFIVPSTDIVNAVKEMYGAASSDAAQDEEINTQIRNALYGSAGEDVTNEDAYYVDMEDSFHVADNLSGPAPNVTDISKRDNTITLRVEYMEDLETGTGGMLYVRQFILNLNEDGSYYVKAIREQQD